jgi:hypothetical protein
MLFSEEKHESICKMGVLSDWHFPGKLYRYQLEIANNPTSLIDHKEVLSIASVVCIYDYKTRLD